ncbi:MAG: hypothetical protein ACP6IP_09895 [Candidatus Njordarchaeia archaeon]
MSYEAYLKKFEIFLDEIEKDRGIGCYNKVVSSLWFALEALLKSILLGDGKNPPEKAGKLISVFAKFYFEGDRVLLDNLNRLYIMRKEVDHRKKIADLAYEEKAYKIFIDVISKIKSTEDIPVKIRKKLSEIKMLNL